jgi:trans-aconitate 2-methyltransferase
LSRLDWDAKSYDRVSSPQTEWGRVVLERLELGGDETVVDAGCGTGRVTEALAARLPRGHVIALDASPGMLAEARRRLAEVAAAGRASFVQADLGELVPADLAGACPVDAVFSTAAFHWVPDHDRLFSNLRSVLRPQGQLVAQCGGKGNIAGVIEAARSLGVERAGAWIYATPEETSARLLKAGFEVIDVWCHPELVSFTDRGAFVDFLGTVCLREHLGRLPPGERRSFAERVAGVMPAPEIDYVRLNIVARAR